MAVFRISKTCTLSFRRSENCLGGLCRIPGPGACQVEEEGADFYPSGFLGETPPDDRLGEMC